MSNEYEPDGGIVYRVLETSLTRRQTLRLITGTTAVVASGGAFTVEAREARESDSIYSAERIRITQEDANLLLGEDSKLLDEEKIIVDINDEGEELSYSSRVLGERLEYAKGWVRDLANQGYQVGLKTALSKDGEGNINATVFMTPEEDFNWGQQDAVAGGVVFVDEIGLYFVNPTTIPGSEVKLIQLDEETRISLQEKLGSLGYSHLTVPEIDSIIAVEVYEGEIVQVISDYAAFKFIAYTFDDIPNNVNVRREPNINSGILLSGLNDSFRVPTPEAIPPDLHRSGMQLDENTGLEYVSDGTNQWILVQTPDGDWGWVAKNVAPQLTRVGEGVVINSKVVFKTNYDILIEANPEALASLPESDWTVVNERAVPNAVLKDTLGINELGELTVSMENGDTMVWIPERRYWGVVEAQLGRTRIIRSTKTTEWIEGIDWETQHLLLDMQPRTPELNAKYPAHTPYLEDVLAFREPNTNTPITEDPLQDFLNAPFVTFFAMAFFKTSSPTDEQLLEIKHRLDNGEDLSITLSNGDEFHPLNGFDYIIDHTRRGGGDLIPPKVGENGRLQVVYTYMSYYTWQVTNFLSGLFRDELIELGIELPDGWNKMDGFPAINRAVTYVAENDLYDPFVYFIQTHPQGPVTDSNYFR